MVGTNATINTIDELNANLNDLINTLSAEGVVTDDDATEFRFRAEILAAELIACIEYPSPGPFDSE